MATLRFEADLSSWTRAFQQTRDALHYLTPAQEEVGEILLNRVRANITESRGVDGPFEPLAPSTLEARGRGVSGKGVRGSKGWAKRVADAKPLIFTGALFRSLTYALDVDGSIIVGSPLRQARRLFFGWTGAGPQTPARNPFALQKRDRSRILRAFVSHIFRWAV